jgi:NAD+ diphosphatase
MVSFKPAVQPVARPARRRECTPLHPRHRFVGVRRRSTGSRATWAVHFLGMLRGQEACWAVDVPHGEDPSYGAASDLYTFYGRTSEVEWALAGRAVQLTDWARTHRFCGRCATPTVPSGQRPVDEVPGVRSARLPAAGAGDDHARHEGRPRAGQQVLLARGVQFRAPMYSCLAGFVEAGRVARACRGARGARGGRAARAQRAVPRQPAVAVPAQPDARFPGRMGGRRHRLRPTEIVDAQWYGRDELPPIPPRSLAS